MAAQNRQLAQSKLLVNERIIHPTHESKWADNLARRSFTGSSKGHRTPSTDLGGPSPPPPTKLTKAGSKGKKSVKRHKVGGKGGPRIS